MVNRFDSSTMHAIDLLVGKWPNFDRAVQFAVGNDLFQGTLAAAVIWWLWFRPGSEASVRRTRDHLIATLCASVPAIIAGRALALSLPFRIRPRWEPTLGYVIPFEPDPNAYMDWSSFPSDHAILFTTLAAGICFVSVRAGALVFICYLLFGALPLMYIGGHYPTDIICGAAIGVLIAWLMNLRAIRQALSVAAQKWERASQGTFFMALFLLTFQIASTFVSVRSAALAMSRYVARLL
jgi:undecaprenyl-diphosphatase